MAAPAQSPLKSLQEECNLAVAWLEAQNNSLEQENKTLYSITPSNSLVSWIAPESEQVKSDRCLALKTRVEKYESIVKIYAHATNLLVTVSNLGESLKKYKGDHLMQSKDCYREGVVIRFHTSNPLKQLVESLEKIDSLVRGFFDQIKTMHEHLDKISSCCEAEAGNKIVSFVFQYGGRSIHSRYRNDYFPLPSFTSEEYPSLQRHLNQFYGEKQLDKSPIDGPKINIPENLVKEVNALVQKRLEIIFNYLKNEYPV